MRDPLASDTDTTRRTVPTRKRPLHISERGQSSECERSHFHGMGPCVTTCKCVLADVTWSVGRQRVVYDGHGAVSPKKLVAIGYRWAQVRCN